MYKLTILTVLVVCFLGVASSSASLTTVTIPDPSPNPYIYYGSGDVSVTYSGVVFFQSGTLSDSALFDVGPVFSGFPAVLSSQEQTFGVANILITLPMSVTSFAMNYGTFDGSAVTFTLSNGYTTVLGSTGFNGYDVPDVFSVTSSSFDSVLVTSPDFVLNINDIMYGTLTTTMPEPGTLMLFGSGLLTLGSMVLRKR
jgi:hypothetical protein